MEVLMDEVESLEAILMDDVKIVRNSEGGVELIETTVLPTVGEDVDRQYVCITLQVIPCEQYPDVKPKWNLRNSRGLDDMSINKIRKAIEEKLHEAVGQPVVFDLIEVIREHLTDSNLPSGQCVICLYGFQDGDEFTKTICYHYLHSYCLARHLIASHKNYEEELEKLPVWQQKSSKPFQPCCPVCREVIDNDVQPLSQCRPPNELLQAPLFEVTTELRGLQEKMSNLFMRQKSRGGIIDLNAEDNNVISIDSEDEASKSRESFVNAADVVTTNTNRPINGNAARSNKNPQRKPDIPANRSDDSQNNKSSHYGHTGRRQGGRRDDHRHHHQRRRHEFHHQNGADQANTTSSNQQPCGSNQR
ncbi:E3 ubiquitin-protein ligase RNF25 [Bradysia coprophila]|uniref:E3 ubiquitin-protein ligase RNF25 n=1 Tax=Bradysia coprophila TaxID=38358 RepID=UPI00187D823C|nr:E3 ubiquitin-protein ligase RNF25 [Bradysia coprophila]